MVRDEAARRRFSSKVDGARERLFALCSTLVSTNSQNPPGDTSAIATIAACFLEQATGVEIQRIEPKAGIVNLVARVGCDTPGRRLIINGHLDTFEVGDPACWTVPPLGGLRQGGRIYGRGACDMKAGLSAALLTALLIAEDVTT